MEHDKTRRALIPVDWRRIATEEEGIWILTSNRREETRLDELASSRRHIVPATLRAVDTSRHVEPDPIQQDSTGITFLKVERTNRISR